MSEVDRETAGVVDPDPTAGALTDAGADAPGTRRAWRRVLTLAAALPVLVMLPLVNLPLTADHRFNVYSHGGDLVRRPWALVTDPIAEIGRYLDFGNFRPLGRMMEQVVDVAAFAVMDLLQVPATVALGLVNLVIAAALGVTCALLAGALTADRPTLSARPSTVSVAAAVGLPVLLVATSGSVTVVYTGIYLLSITLVLLTVLAAVRLRWFRSTGSPPLLVLGAVVVGGGLAAYNEMTYLAPPLAVIGVLARGLLTLRLSMGELVRTTATRLVVAGGLGFAAVFVPVRLIIARHCAATTCYAASDLSIGPDAAGAWWQRVLTAAPGAAWRADADASPWSAWQGMVWPAQALVLTGAVAVAALALRLARDTRLPEPRAAAAPVLVGVGLLALATLLAALSTTVQAVTGSGQWRVGQGWRDTAGAAAAVALIGAGLVTAVAAAAPRARRAVLSVALCLAVLGGAVTTVANQGYVRGLRPSPAADVNDRIALSVISAPTQEERCALRDEFIALYPDRLHWQDRITESLDTAWTTLHGEPYCARRP